MPETEEMQRPPPPASQIAVLVRISPQSGENFGSQAEEM
jgi:hypothetical protein